MKNSTTTTCPVAKFKRIATLTLLMFAIFYVALSQTKQIDSIKQCIGRMQDDTNKANTLNALAYKLINTGSFDSTLHYTMQSKTISEQLSYKKGLATSLNINGNVYFKKGNYPLSLDYYFKALKINEGIKNDKGIASQLNNIGNVFSAMNDLDKALDYSIRALNIFNKVGDKTLIAHTLSNIGGLYMVKKNYLNANEYILKSITIYNELGDRQNVGRSITIIGMIESNKGNYNEALNYFFKAISLNDMNDKENTATLYGNIGEALMNQKKYLESKKYYMKSIKIGKDIGSLGIISESSRSLSQIYDKTGYKALALDFYKQFVSAKDSLTNEENTKNIVRQEMNFDFDKKQAVMKAVQEKHDAVSVAENKRQRTVIYGAIIGLIMVVVFSVFLFNRFRVTKKQNNIIKSQKLEVERQRHLADEKRILAEEQKFVIEEKQKEILGSIRYAKRIQDSLLPTEDYIQNTLNRLIKTN